MTKPRDSLATELFSELFMAEQLARHQLARALPKGMELSQFSVLNHLSGTTDSRTPAQIARTFNLTKGAIQKIEERESTGQITLNKLRDVGNALDMQLVYGFVPKDESIENLINIRAEKLARKIVLRTNQNMKLEDQGIGDEKIAKTIKELANEIKREMKKSLWD